MELPTLFFEHHPNPMLIFDTNTLEIIEINKSAEKKYGYSRDEFRMLTIEDIRPPEDIPELRDKLNNLGKKVKASEVGTVRHQKKDGEILYVQIFTQFFPISGRDARVVHVHDISETIRLKNKVEEAYRNQQHHIDNNPLGMLKYDKNFRVVEWSNRAEEKSGYTKNEILGTSIFEMDLLDKDDQEFVEDRILKISSGEIERDRFETTIKLKNGEPLEVLIHASALCDADGNLKSVLAFIEDISDQKNYERQLEKREQKYRRLFQDANDGIILMNGMTFVDCNRRATEIFETDQERLIGKTPLDFLPAMQPDGKRSLEKFEEKLELVEEDKPQVFESKFQTSDQKLIDVEVNLNKIDLGTDHYIQAILRDLTEQKKIKRELEGERERLKRAQNLARLGWWSYEVKENKVRWSDVLFKILDVEKENFEATFEAFIELVHPDDREKLESVMERAQEVEKPIDYTLRIIKQDKDEIIYAKCRAQSKFNGDGELVLLSGVLQDITQQKSAREELKRNKELFESLFLNSPVAIAMIDVNGKVQKLNKSFEELFGYSEELIGKDLLKHQLPEERHDEIKKIYENVFSNRGVSKYYEDQRITKNGETKELLVGALPVIIDGEPIAAFGIYIDITKLRATEKHLKNSLKEKEILLAEVHHRVKNNLAIISGLLLLEAMNWGENSEVHKVLMQSKLRIHSMAKVHEKLYQSGDFSNLNLENYVTELVQTIFEAMHGEEKEVQLDVQSDEINLNINQAIPCALIVNELITNSFKYAFEEERKSELEVKFKRKGERISIVVHDNGPGLPDNFENMTEKSLGHRLVNQLVKQLDGKIEVQSKESEGTRYEVEFMKKSKSGSASNYFV